jgi:hypothetical protein
LYERLDAEGIATDKQRGLHILSWLAQEGLICCGPRAGKQQTFVLLDEWVPATPKVTREQALAMLAQRYFAHHGPATLADFAWWAGLTVADAKAGIEAAEPTLISESLDKTTWWSGAHRRSTSSRVCYLLPVYDEYMVGYSDRSALLDPAHAKRVAAYGLLGPAIIINGSFVGSWTRELNKEDVVIRLAPLKRFDREQLRLIEEAAARYAAFLGLEAKVTKA